MGGYLEKWASEFPEADIYRRNTPLSMSHIKDWSKVDNETGCWIWLKAKSRHGYGVLRSNGRTTRAHRASYELFHCVSVPSNEDICHKCDVRLCVNPEHLFRGTRTENMRDCAKKGRIKIPGLRGSNVKHAKLTEADIIPIRSSTKSQRALAAEYGVSRKAIVCVKRGETWKHVK